MTPTKGGVRQRQEQDLGVLTPPSTRKRINSEREDVSEADPPTPTRARSRPSRSTYLGSSSSSATTTVREEPESDISDSEDDDSEGDDSDDSESEVNHRDQPLPPAEIIPPEHEPPHWPCSHKPTCLIAESCF